MELFALKHLYVLSDFKCIKSLKVALYKEFLTLKKLVI